MKRILFSVLTTLFAAALLWGCNGGSSSATTGTLTQAEFDSMLTASATFKALQAQIAAMKVQVVTSKTVAASTRSIQSVGSTTTTAQPQATVSSGGTLIGTFEGYVTFSNGQLVPSLQTNSVGIGILSAQGYMAYSSLDGRIFPQPDLYYASTDCSGHPYMYTVGGSNGLVFRSGDTLDASVADPSTYWAIAPGQTQVAVTFYSEQTSPGNCVAVGGTVTTALEAVPNVASVTGFQSASQGSLAQSGP